MADESKYQKSILDAIDYLVNNRVQNLDRDKTIVAGIVACSNALKQEYKVSYNGGTIVAYAQDGANYERNQSVYVLVPQGDFSARKTIIGKATNVTDDKNITFVSSLLSDYNMIGRNSVDNHDKDPVCGLHSYLKTEYQMLYQRDEDPDNPNLINVNQEELKSYLSDAEAVLLEGSFKTRLPKSHRNSKGGKYGLQMVLAFRNKDYADSDYLPEQAIRHVSYSIDSDLMTGNPTLYENWTDQYNIYSFDKNAFLYVESIMAYCQDYVDADNISQANLWGPDIFFKDIEFYGLRKIEAKNGEYVLRVSTPQGAIFKTTTADEKLTVLCSIKKSETTDLSDSTTYYWFAKDDRVSSTSKDYHMYGGAGWKYLKDLNNNKQITLSAYNNRAYENKYLVVAVYKSEIILKQKFSIYNEACSRSIEIKSNLGTKFAFDRGIPILTCLVNGKDKDFEVDLGKDDSLFDFSWSMTDTSGFVTNFTTSKSELEKQYKELMRQFNDPKVEKKPTYSDLAAIKSQITAMDGVEFNRNVLTYPVSKITDSAIFSCSVFMKENSTAESFFVGSASITLRNETEAEVAAYSIIIENGNQVFQYSESGVSPTNERYTDPIEIKPLACHFYDPAGLEVSNETYTVSWRFPLENTLIVTPKNLTMNQANSKIELLPQQTCLFSIQDSYDYFALNNQLTCIVNYQGVEYTKDTDFFFAKIGDNGTNGTDVVAKISPKTAPKDTLFSIRTMTQLNADGSYKTEEVDGRQVDVSYWEFNNGNAKNVAPLKFELFNRNNLLDVDESSVSWKMSGNANKTNYMSIAANGVINYDFTKSGEVGKGWNTNQIVRASATVAANEGADKQTYYAFYPVPVIDYHRSVVTEVGNDRFGLPVYDVKFDKTKTLKNILYNADGRLPLYNENQGAFFSLGDIGNRHIILRAEGGANDDTTTAAFTLYTEEDGIKKSSTIIAQDLNYSIKEEYEEDGETKTRDIQKVFDHVYVKPNDNYDGAYVNNRIHGLIFAENVEESARVDGNAEVEFYLPIHISLNTYGLSSLNAWDGNKIEINEDSNYILAPQVGAGEKDSENKFTGIVMGKAETYPDAQNKKSTAIGLLGYSHGKQSIWLDSETGNATFGLPEDEASAQNRYTEGRIKLVPGGTSSIGAWNIGSRVLYNMSTAPVMRSVEQKDDQGKGTGIYDAQVYDKATKTWSESVGDTRNASAVRKEYYAPEKLVGNNNPEQNYKSYTGESKYRVDNATLNFDPYSQGAILGANPAYLSIKSIPLTRFSSDIDFDSANAALKDGDSLEIEIDPMKTSIFSIYRHTPYLDAKGNQELTDEGLPKFTRYPLVGINSAGQFYTNAIQDQESSMGIGKVGAFGKTASDNKYIGAQFAYGTKNILKFYVKNQDNVNKDDENKDTLFLSTGSQISDEYDRPFKIYGKNVELYASPQSTREEQTKEFSNHALKISSSEISLGHSDVYLKMPAAANAEFKTRNGLDVGVSKATSMSFGTTTGHPLSVTASGLVTGIYKNGRTITTSGQDSLAATNKVVAIGGTGDNKSSLEMSTLALKLDRGGKQSITFGSADDVVIKSPNSITIKNGGGGDTEGGHVYITNTGAEGIVLTSNYNKYSNKASSGLSLMPPNGETNGTASSFSLSSGQGSVWTTTESIGSVSDRAVVRIDDGFHTRWGYFTGNGFSDGQYNFSLKADKIIYSDDWIWSNNNIYGADICFNDSRTYRSGSWASGTSTSINAFLDNIYWYLNLLKNSVTAVENRCSSLESWRNSKTFASESWVNRNYTSKDTFNNHGHWDARNNSHRVLNQWDTYQIDGQDVSHIRVVTDLGTIRTSAPVQLP